MRFGLWNVQGLSTKTFNKLEMPDFVKLFGSNQNDIVLFTETWTNDMTNIDVIDLTCIPLHRRLKRNLRSGTRGDYFVLQELRF